MITTETVKKAIASYKSTQQLRIVAAEKLKKPQIDGAKRNLAKGHTVFHPLGILDESFFKNGSKGFLVTSKVLYFSKEHWSYDEDSGYESKLVHLDGLCEVIKGENNILYVKNAHGWDRVDCGKFQEDFYNFFTLLLKLSNEEPKPIEKPKPVEKPKKPLEEKIGRSNFPVVGAVCRFGGEIIFFYDMNHDGKGNRRWNKFSGRQFMTGESVTVLVGWDTDCEYPQYTTTYITPEERAGSKRQLVYENCYTEHFYGSVKNVTFEQLRSEWRVCRYNGNFSCDDLKSKETFRFDGSKWATKDIEKLQKGDLIIVCIFREKPFFVTALKKRELGIFWYKKDSDAFIEISANPSIIPAKDVMVENEQGLVYTFFSENDYRRLTGYSSGIGTEKLFHKFIAEPAAPVEHLGWIYAKKEGKRGTMFFKEHNSGNLFTMNPFEVPEEYFERFCDNPFFALVAGFENHKSVTIKELFRTKSAEFEWTYSLEEDGKAVLMNQESFESFEIPLEKMPQDAKEGDVLKARVSQNNGVTYIEL